MVQSLSGVYSGTKSRKSGQRPVTDLSQRVMIRMAAIRRVGPPRTKQTLTILASSPFRIVAQTRLTSVAQVCNPTLAPPTRLG